MNAENAVDEPMLIRAKRKLIIADRPIQARGNVVRDPTLAKSPDPGRPFSRANAQVVREAVPRYPPFEMTIAAMTTEVWSN